MRPYGGGTKDTDHYAMNKFVIIAQQTTVDVASSFVHHS